jgi:MFS family permease
MYKKILQDPLIFRLSLVQLIAYFGAWFSNVAIYTMILEFRVDSIINAIVVSMYALPALLAPLSGAIVDKFQFKRFMILMLIIELVMTLFYLSIRDISQVPLLMFFIFIRMTAASLFFQAEMSLLPQVVAKDALKAANELHSIIWSVTFALGMALGGIAVDSVGIEGTIMIDIGLFIVAIMIFSTIRFEVVKESSDSILLLIKEGFYYLKRDKGLLHLIAIHAVVALTSFDALVNLLTDSIYKEVIAIPLAIGWLNATRAFGLMVGPLLIGSRVNHRNLHLIFIVQGIMIILWAMVEHSFVMSLGMMFFIGFFTTTLWSYTYTLIQTHTEAKYLGRVVAYNDMIFMMVSIVVTMFIGAAYKWGISLPTITIMIGSGFILLGGYYLWFKKEYHTFLESKSY